jgi:hypothetical protein
MKILEVTLSRVEASDGTFRPKQFGHCMSRVRRLCTDATIFMWPFYP